MCSRAHHVIAYHQTEAKQEASASRLEGGPQEGKNVLPLGASGGLPAARAHNGMARALTRAHDALCFAQEGLCIAGSTARHTSSSVSYFSSMGGVCGEVSVHGVALQRALCWPLRRYSAKAAKDTTEVLSTARAATERKMDSVAQPFRGLPLLIIPSQAGETDMLHALLAPSARWVERWVDDHV